MRSGADWRILGVGLAGRAVEDVVRRDLHQPRPRLTASRREHLGSEAVHSGRGRFVLLRSVDVGPRRGVDYDIVAGNGRSDIRRFADVQLRPGDRRHLTASQDGHEVLAEHPACSRDEPARHPATLWISWVNPHGLGTRMRIAR